MTENHARAAPSAPYASAPYASGARAIGRGPAPDVQYIRKRGDLKRVIFTDGVALVDVPIGLVRHIKFKNHRRENSDRLRRLERSVRDRGFSPVEPIIARIGQRGRWVIVDGGHRLTAAQSIATEFWCNLFSKKVYSLYFLLYETPRSWRKTRRPRAMGAAQMGDPQSDP